MTRAEREVLRMTEWQLTDWAKRLIRVRRPSGRYFEWTDECRRAALALAAELRKLAKEVRRG